MKEQTVVNVMSGEARGAGAVILRGALSIAEPAYASLMRVRNALYDAGIKRSHRLAVPVVSVGNITAGGTGKTPIVRWLAQRMAELGMKPAILMRGYKRARGGAGDEEQMLRSYLPGIPVHADPDRVKGACHILREHPDTDLFILDDAFQHRRLARDFDLVLIDAANPFGFGHVHPRGLLREPLAGLRRADAFVITRSDAVSPDRLRELTDLLRAYGPTAPTYRARHVQTCVRVGEAELPIESLAGQRFFAVAGIASPARLEPQLSKLPGAYVGHHWYGDHHVYTAEHLAEVRRLAAGAGADVILTTEKDYVKIASLPSSAPADPPIWRLQLQIEFDAPGEAGLLELIGTRIERSPALS